MAGCPFPSEEGDRLIYPEMFRLRKAETHARKVETAARALYDLLQEKPRHTVDSAPFREAVWALGVALGVEGK